MTNYSLIFKKKNVLNKIDDNNCTYFRNKYNFVAELIKKIIKMFSHNNY